MENCVCSTFFFSSRRRHTRCSRDWSSDVCSSDLEIVVGKLLALKLLRGRKSLRRASCGHIQRGGLRSEEHTSELQSRLHLVCRLLLEKKNTLFITKMRAQHGILNHAGHSIRQSNA